MMQTVLGRVKASLARSKGHRKPSLRFALECLERRDVPATYSVGAGDVSGLVSAIIAANSNGESNVVQLAAGSTYSFTTVDNYWFGPNALPAIASPLAIEGNGAIIQRSVTAGTPAMRLFCVLGGPVLGSQAAGSLSLSHLTLTGGYALGGSSGTGGGGLGAGGAIFNMGTLRLDGVAVQFNGSQGGSSGVTSGDGGGGIGEDATSGNTGGLAGGFGGPFPGYLPGSQHTDGTLGNYGGGYGDGAFNKGGGGGNGFVEAGGSDSDGTGGKGGGLSLLGGYGGSDGTTPGGVGGDGGGGGGFGYGGNGASFGFGAANSFISSESTGSKFPGGGGGGVGGGGAMGGGGGISGSSGGGGGGGFGGGGGSAFGAATGGNGGFGGGGGGGPDLHGLGGGSVFGGGRGANGPTASGYSGIAYTGGGGAGMGGGLFNFYGTATIINSTFAGNYAYGGGGGLGSGAGAGGSAYGGALFNLNGTVTLLNSTLANNTLAGGASGVTLGASQGTAVYNLSLGFTPSGGMVSAIVNLGNSILVGDGGQGFTLNNVGVNGSATVNALGPNLVNGGGPSYRVEGYATTNGPAFLTTTPLLGPLQNNGGTTNTLAELPGSPTLGAGSTTLLTSVGDQTIARSQTDVDMGEVYINQQPFRGQNTPLAFSFYAQPQAVGHDVTPLIFSVSGSTYTLVNVYQSIRAGQAGVNSAPLTLLQGGNLDPNMDYVFGFSDQQVSAGNGTTVNSVSSTAGTIAFETGTPGNWLHTQGNTIIALTLGASFSSRISGTNTLYGGRIYSALLTLSASTLPYDQRGSGYARVVNGSVDLGAYQAQATAIIAVGDPKPNRRSTIRVFDATDRTLKFDFTPFGNQTRGVRVAVGDVNGDGVPDIITAAGPGGLPLVKTFDGRNGELLTSFLAYESQYRGGVYVAAGDLDGDGNLEIITSSGAGRAPWVKVFDGRHAVLKSAFLADSPAFRGGLTVAVGDVNGDGRSEIITGAGPGKAPVVKVFDSHDAIVTSTFLAYALRFRGGVYVAAGDTNGNGRSLVITGRGKGGTPRVKLFDGRDGTMQASYLAFPPRFRGGVRVGVVKSSNVGLVDVLNGRGAGDGTRVVLRDGRSFRKIYGFRPFGRGDRGGVFIAG